MFETSCTPARQREGKTHDFLPLSGWCRHGCGNRDDGRVVTAAGFVIHAGPHYTDAELGGLFEFASETLNATNPRKDAR